MKTGNVSKKQYPDQNVEKDDAKNASRNPSPKVCVPKQYYIKFYINNLANTFLNEFKFHIDDLKEKKYSPTNILSGRSYYRMAKT